MCEHDCSQETLTFPFARLPPEIRRAVWDLAASEPRTLKVHYDISTGTISSNPPSLLHVCRESRYFLLEKSSPNGVIFNAASDALHIKSTTSNSALRTYQQQQLRSPPNRAVSSISDFVDKLIPRHQEEEIKVMSPGSNLTSGNRIRYLEVDHLVFIWLISGMRQRFFSSVDQLKIILIDSICLGSLAEGELWTYHSIHDMWSRCLFTLRTYYPDWRPPVVTWTGREGRQLQLCDKICCKRD
ncbi:hypothetical protein F5884DRAFT_143114 [Xylogone sp. PMI_703]|nr:hypothetical protein F5884DRAFT_143114 [Xylogone sp. PMI_703]